MESLRDWCHELHWYTCMKSTCYYNKFWNFPRIVLYVRVKQGFEKKHVFLMNLFVNNNDIVSTVDQHCSLKLTWSNPCIVLLLVEQSKKDQNCNFQVLTMSQSWFQNSFGIMIGPFSLIEISKAWGTNKQTNKWKFQYAQPDLEPHHAN